MYVDDKQRHPMLFQIRMQFCGQIDRTAFEAATRVALSRHPLLSSHIAGERLREWHWVPVAGEAPFIEFAEAGTPLVMPGQGRIDLAKETGVRCFVRSGNDQVDIRWLFHHSCCDGIGAYRYLEDLLCSYAAAVSGDVATAQFRPMDPESLEDRDRFGLGLWSRLFRLPLDVWGVVVGLGVFFIVTPKPIATPMAPEFREEVAAQVLDMPAHTFTPEQSKALRAAAKESGGTLNDLLLADTFAGLTDWNKRHRPRGPGLVRLMVPVSLRPEGSVDMPAANSVGMVNLDRPAFWLRWPRLLAKTLRWEMNFLKFFRLAIAYERICQLITTIPGGMHWFAGLKRCQATATVSNMGRLFDDIPLPRKDGRVAAGGMVLQAIESAPPVRSLTAASFTALSYAGQFTLIMNYDRWHFTPETAQEVLASVVRRLESSARATCPTPELHAVGKQA